MKGRIQRVFPVRIYTQPEATDQGWKLNLFPCKRLQKVAIDWKRVTCQEYPTTIFY